MTRRMNLFFVTALLAGITPSAQATHPTVQHFADIQVCNMQPDAIELAGVLIANGREQARAAMDLKIIEGKCDRKPASVRSTDLFLKIGVFNGIAMLVVTTPGGYVIMGVAEGPRMHV